MKKQQAEPEAGTMEAYIHKLIKSCDDRLNDKDNPVSFASFQYHTGAKNVLYRLLTGYSNPQSNPAPKKK